MENWVNNAQDKGFVLSSRVRLARNLNIVPFPDRVNDEKGKEIARDIEDSFLTNTKGDNYDVIRLWETDNTLQKVYLEKHLISKKLLENNNKSSFFVNKDETVSIMINEEDHIRLQCITAGLNLKEAFEKANEIDNILEDVLDFAFDEKLGYITACPTNLGTGMRASVMMHLPALTMNNEMSQVLNAVAKVGMTVRGLYGEGSKAEGSLYQISNQLTLGLSEEEIINNLSAVVSQLINQEIIARNQLMSKYEFELKDKIFRSLGLLRSAMLIDTKETLNLLSNVRLGIEMGIINDIDIKIINRLLIEVNTSNIIYDSKKNLSEKEVKLKRAEILREKLSKGGDVL